MARKYNKIDYGSLNPYELPNEDLRQIMYNLASTANARIKAAKKEDSFIQAVSDISYFTKKLQATHPEYFTKNGMIKKRTAKMTDQEVRDMIDDVASYLIVGKKTVKETKQYIEEIEKSGGKDQMRKLKSLWHRDKDEFMKKYGESKAKIVENTPSDPDDDYEDSSSVSREDILGTEDWTDMSQEEQVARLARLSAQVKRYRKKV